MVLPTPEERRAIAAGMVERLMRGLRRTDRPILDAAVLDELAAAPIDLREAQRRLAQAVGVAVLGGRRRIRATHLPVSACGARPRGFVE